MAAPRGSSAMKISIEWLKEYVDIPESPDKLKEDLTMIGLLVESVTETQGTHVFEIEVTSNRPDCLSHVGIAREVAALYRRPLRSPLVQEKLSVSSERIPYQIESRDPDLCPRYVALVMDSIKVGPSPAWMQRRLEAAGMRPLNSIVDITNYVLLEMGHPLHAFDFDLLRQGKIVVGRANPAAKFQTLDGIERGLDGDMLMINDGEGPVAIAGVMGGLNSEISLTTTRVLLESAYFQPASIRRTSKKLGLSTEASYRFERGTDWENTIPAIARTCQLIEQLAGGKIAGSLQDVYPARKEPVRISLTQKQVTALLGADLSAEFIQSTLERLQFKLDAKGRGSWEVTCPTYRADMELEADLIEELARFYGYQNIPVTLPPSQTVGIPSPVYRLEGAIREILRGQGYSEAINLSFASESDYPDFPPVQGERVAVRNPLTEDTQFMRTTLAPGLVRSAKRNFNFDQRLVRLFEIGKVYRLGADGNPVERNTLGILGTGGFTDYNWKNPEVSYDFYHTKGEIEALLKGIRIGSYEIEPVTGVGWLNPAASAALRIGGETVGVFGAISSPLLEKFKLKQPVYLAEIDFEGMTPFAFSPIYYESLPRYPSAERDISIVVNQNLPYQAINKGILNLGIPELMQISLNDVYKGEKIPAGKVSLTLRLTFQDREKTLTVDRVQGFIDTVLSFLNKTYGAGLRSL
jgi:phenylalanyl-tRNA synthetase beta chain